MSVVRPLAAAAGVVALIAGGVWLARPDDDGASPAPSGDRALTGEVVVLAAASLGEAFEAVEAELEAAHPGLDVVVSLGPSSALAAQVAAGAPADVLVTASEATMATAVDALRDAHVLGADDATPVVVATNTMALALPGPAAPGGGPDTPLASLADVARPGVRLAVCEEQVPCGAGATAVLRAAGLDPVPATLEADVGGVLTKVALGEVDAGLVYASDVRPDAPRVLDGTVAGVALEPDVAAAFVTSYPALSLPEAPHPDAARAVVDLLTSPRGAALLRDAGFGTP